MNLGRMPCEHEGGDKVMFLVAKEHQQWPTNQQKPDRELKHILLQPSEGTSPDDTLP